MLYVLIGLVSAMLFGIGAVTVYGYESLLDHPWIEHVFWSLIATGAGLALLEHAFSLSCRLCKHLPAVLGPCHEVPCR